MPRLSAALFLILVACAPHGRGDARPVPPPEIMSRASWGARPPVLPMQPHRVEWITIHHTATRQQPERGLADKLIALQRFSQSPGALAGGGQKPAWPDVPYHLYVDAAGGVAEGRSPEYAGDTNTDYDPRGHLLVVLEGNFEEEHPTPAQLAALRRLIASMSSRYGVPAERIQGHRDHARTLCPGANLQRLLPELRGAAARPGRGR